MDWEKTDPQDTNVIMNMYRGEMQRINTWRQRMDRTTNWTIVITVGVITFALGNPLAPHWTVLPGLFWVYVLLFLEARRYRDFDAWRGRVRMLEEEFLGKFFDPDMQADEGWEKMLAYDLRNPRHKITWQEAVKRRLKRIYLWVIATFVVTWIGKIYIHPEPIGSSKDFFGRIFGPSYVSYGFTFFLLIVGLVIVSSVYFLSAAPGREARGFTDERQIDEKFGSREYIEEFERTDKEKNSNTN